VNAHDRREPPPLRTRLERTRQAYGLSREKLASRAGCTSHSIWRLEREGDMPRLDTAYLLARALNVSIEELFGDRLEVKR